MKRTKAVSLPIFAAFLKSHGVESPVAEYRFFETRRWRFDYAWPKSRVALEVEGGVWTGGRHTRGAGFLADVEKYNTAASMGWLVLRCTPQTLLSRETALTIKSTLVWIWPTDPAKFPGVARQV